ncbi:MAG: MurR/RpiR family transcriptional regulator, partial [Deltaproteobacteria bacterium]|nr:MurR/RpiR family transcriptional regulator [Deltaproteobacteria bacterium]
MAKQKRKHDKMNVVQMINSRYDQMNSTNKNIADFILQNLEKATFYTLSDISREIGFSDATLIRFAKELGYSGYRGLRADLVNYIKQIIQPAHKKAFIGTNEQDSITEMVMKRDIEYISRTISKIDRE